MGWGNPFKKAKKQLKRATRSVEKAVSKSVKQVESQTQRASRQVQRETSRLDAKVDFERIGINMLTGGGYELTRAGAEALEDPWRELTGQTAMEEYMKALEDQETIQFLGTGFEEEEEEEEITFGSVSSAEGDGRESVLRSETGGVDTGLSIGGGTGVGI